MDQIGQEFFLPGILPREPWEQSGRWTGMGDNMFRLKDRKGARPLPGHDPRRDHDHHRTQRVAQLQAVAADLVPDSNQVRDEPRPKSGLLRVRQFTMKDSYSF